MKYTENLGQFEVIIPVAGQVISSLTSGIYSSKIAEEQRKIEEIRAKSQTKDNTVLYLAIGGGVLLLGTIIFVATR